MRIRLRLAAVALLTVVAGLAIRLGPLGLPWTVRKYGGSMLWAAMIYWLLALAWSRLSPVVLIVVAGLTATLVELSRLYHTPGLDAFRVSLPGVLLLGRFFSMQDIAAYWLAIVVAAWLDLGVIRRSVAGTSLV